MIIYVLQTDRRVLVQPSNHFGTSNTTVDDILPILLEFVENINWNHQGPKNTENNKEVIHPQLTPLNLRHYRILLILTVNLSPQRLRFLHHLHLTLSRSLHIMLQHVLCNLQFRIKISYFIQSALVNRWIDFFIRNLINLWNAHISYFREFILPDTFPYLLLNHTFLFSRMHISQFLLSLLYRLHFFLHN
jgi:hypothetical protein